MKRLFFLPLFGLFMLFSFSIAVAQTGYTDDCSTITGWTGGVQWDNSATGTSVIASISKNQPSDNLWHSGITYNIPGGPLDISAAPYVSVKIKPIDDPLLLYLYLYDGTNNDLDFKRVHRAKDFITITWDFSAASNVDLTSVSSLFLKVNPMARSWYDDLEFDEIRIGDHVVPMANFGAVENIEAYQGSTGNEIVVTNIENAAAISLTGAGGLIENVSVSAIVNGIATISFDVQASATGTETATITATGVSPFGDNTFDFDIVVEDNLPPTINEIDDLKAASGVEQVVRLTGLTDGNATLEQTLTITGSSDNAGVTGAFTVDYDAGSPYADLRFTPTGDQEGITVTVNVDDGGASIDSTFILDVYTNYNNMPTMNDIAAAEFFSSTNKSSLQLSGISDGDGGTQTLTFAVTSSVDSVVDNASLEIQYVPGQTIALLKFIPNKIGFTDITLQIGDDGAAAGNNGDQVLEVTFPLEVKPEPLSGYVFDLSVVDSTGDKDEFIVSGPGKWFLEDNFGNQTLDVGTYHGFDDVIHIALSNKFRWDGIWLRTPDFDLTNDPVLSYDIYVEGTDFETHTYFWDVGWDGGLNRNTTATHAERKSVAADQWVHVYMDFRAPGMLNNSDGVPINIERIQKLLFNYHTGFTSGDGLFNGDVYIKDIRIGDQAVGVPPRTEYCTMSDLSDLSYILDGAAAQEDILLTDITDGHGTIDDLTLTVSSDNAGWLSPTVSAINADGTATLSYTPPASIGSATITLNLTNGGGSYDKDVVFDIAVLDDNAGNASTIDIDLGTTYQTIHGFGTWYNKPVYNDLYAKNCGNSAMRIGFIGNQLETINDNNDVNVLNRERLNYDVFNWDYLIDLKEKGVETFILTSWSPPGWMKDNFIANYGRAGVQTNTDLTDNRLSYHMYEEFAEMCVAAYRVIEEETGIKLKGIGVQNEPAFHENYPSAILDPTHFADLIAVVGARFEAEGITDCELYMPEQVFSQGANSMAAYIDAVQANALANQYCGVIATHGYSQNGIDPGAPDNSAWTAMWNNAQEGSYPKEMWMTETWPQYYCWSCDAAGEGVASLVLATNIYGALEFGNVSLWTSWGIDNQLIIQAQPTKSFWVQKQYAKFIRPGAVRVNTASSNVEVLATSFLNESADGGNIASVLINKSTSPVAIDLSVTGGTVPTQYEVYQSSENRQCEHMGTLASGDLIALPPLSITTVVGVGTEYSLTVTNGSGDGNYAATREVVITADPAPGGQEFDQWIGDDQFVLDKSSATTVVTMPAGNVSVEATYRDLPIFDLTVVNGTGAGSYLFDEVINVDAIPSTGDSSFYRWEGSTGILIDQEIDIYDSTITFNMPGENMNLIATYLDNSAVTYTLTVNGGTIDGSGGQSTMTLLDNDVVSITADDPVRGYMFSAWTGDVSALSSTSTASTNVTISGADVEVTATYELVTFTVNVTNGSGSGSYGIDSIVDLIANTPSTGLQFSHWGEEDSIYVDDIYNDTSFIVMPEANLSVTAFYKTEEHNVTVRVLDSETSNPISGADVTQDDETQITATNGEVIFVVKYSGTAFQVSAAGYVTQLVPVASPVTEDQTVIVNLVPEGVDIEEDLSTLIAVYPNPANNFVNITFGGLKVNTIYVSDMSGRLIHLFDGFDASNQITIPTSSFSHGMYIISVNTNKGIYRTELIIE